ncbi:P-II family nitrogen regulator [Alkalibacterium sp. 20]|uniref:P-II family nitrogen regulator n=1 Tax=Alkalibacterium sp. 20 TaxID=1798803 RepID=UPI0009002EEF|nr:P-II family nitrogen regulator [Alkalibacterium sp. 20]OJF93773.1 hypothetical protein AX762_08800 [Alkalibacterium sp. 20]
MTVSFFPMKKIEIIIERFQLKKAIKLLDSAGAVGYTVINSVDGKGTHGLREESVTMLDVIQNAMIISVVKEETALEIIEGIQDLFETYSGVVYVSDVQVLRREHFEK